MADPSIYTYPSPLAPYTGTSVLPLPTSRTADGKSLVNIQTGVLSESYEKFVSPLDNGIRGAFDVHIYHFQKNKGQATYAKELWERIRREFPELRIYTFWTEPIGPHLVAMFEVNIHTPAQFGAFIPWLIINRGPLSALLHPNTVTPNGEPLDEYRDHTQLASWLGPALPIDLSLFTPLRQQKEAERVAERQQTAIAQNGTGGSVRDELRAVKLGE